MDDAGPSGRLREASTILAFDLGGPLLAYALLRSAGFSAVAALVISGVLPVLGTRRRRPNAWPHPRESAGQPDPGH